MRVYAPPSAVGSSTGYLLLDTTPTQLALPASKIFNVSRAIEWKAEPPTPFGSLLPIRFRVPEPEWILRISGISGPVAALVSGAIRIVYLRKASLLSMPTRTHVGFDFYSEVILADGKPSALVVNIDALPRAHREVDI